MVSSPDTGASRGDLHLSASTSLHDSAHRHLQHIQNESDSQVSEQARLQQEIEQLAVSNYRQFIESAACLSQCRTEVQKIDSFHTSLQTMAGDLSRKIVSYSSDNLNQVTEAAVQTALNQCYPLLVNLLDMPYLMETCIAEAAYDEALDIRDHAKALIQRFPDIRILAIIGTAVEKNTELMLQDFFCILENVVELPVSLQTIGHIKRLGRFTDHEIQMLFLQRREIFLESKLASESPTDMSALSSAVRYLDVIRINLFEIVTQFQAMFTKDNGLLQFWVSHRVENILNMLKTHLPAINNGSSIATLLEQAMYCGMSLGTIGIDFRGTLVPIFHQKVFDLFSQAMHRCFRLFINSLSWVVDQASLEKVCISIPDQSSIELVPEIFLFPPHAILINGVFQALNQIKDCIFVQVQSDIASQVEELLFKCSSHLACMPHAAQTQLQELCRAFCDYVIPTCEHALLFLTSMQLALDRNKIVTLLSSARLYLVECADEQVRFSKRAEQREHFLEPQNADKDEKLSERDESSPEFQNAQQFSERNEQTLSFFDLQNAENHEQFSAPVEQTQNPQNVENDDQFSAPVEQTENPQNAENDDQFSAPVEQTENPKSAENDDQFSAPVEQTQNPQNAQLFSEQTESSFDPQNAQHFSEQTESSFDPQNAEIHEQFSERVEQTENPQNAENHEQISEQTESCFDPQNAENHEQFSARFEQTEPENADSHEQMAERAEKPDNNA